MSTVYEGGIARALLSCLYPYLHIPTFGITPPPCKCSFNYAQRSNNLLSSPPSIHKTSCLFLRTLSLCKTALNSYSPTLCAVYNVYSQSNRVAHIFQCVTIFQFRYEGMNRDNPTLSKLGDSADMQPVLPFYPKHSLDNPGNYLFLLSKQYIFRGNVSKILIVRFSKKLYWMQLRKIRNTSDCLQSSWC